MTGSRTRLESIVARVALIALGALALRGCARHAGSAPAPAPTPARAATATGATGATGAHDATVTVRYQVADIERAAAFYTEHLGFRLAEQSGSAFAAVYRGELRLILSGPGSSGSRPMPDGRQQAPGGWNRILIYVDALDLLVERLRSAGIRFRNSVEAGPGGRQILIEDPDGNPIELHEPPARDRP